MKQPDAKNIGYSSGHPWFYVLGGTVQSPKAILIDVIARGYKGYREDEISAANQKAEPQRSEALRVLQDKALQTLRSDLARYRQAARELSQYRCSLGANREVTTCEPAHTAISLKRCHLYNELAHLVWLDELLALQPDLFAR